VRGQDALATAGETPALRSVCVVVTRTNFLGMDWDRAAEKDTPGNPDRDNDTAVTSEQKLVPVAASERTGLLMPEGSAGVPPAVSGASRPHLAKLSSATAGGFLTGKRNPARTSSHFD